MNKTIYNHMIDVAFEVKGPWENLEDIPYPVLLEAFKNFLSCPNSLAQNGSIYLSKVQKGRVLVFVANTKSNTHLNGK